MSKLANHSIKYDDSISVVLLKDSLEIKNTKKNISLPLNGISVSVDEVLHTCTFFIDKKDKTVSKSNLGTVVSLFKTAIKDFDKPYSLILITQGVGFKAMVLTNNMLLMWIGRSHLYCVKFPNGITVSAKDNKISLSGDRVAVTTLASIIQTNRKWDPCMKKGIIIEGKFVIYKETKKKK